MPDKKQPLPLDKQNKSYMWIEPTPPAAPARPKQKAAPSITRPPRKMPPVQNVMPKTRLSRA